MPRLAVWGPVVILNYQPVLVYHCFAVCGIPQIRSSRVSALAVGIEVSRGHRTAFPLSNNSLPVQFSRWSLSCLPFSLIVDIHNPCHLLSPSFNVDPNYIAERVLAEVDPFVGCEAAPIAHRSPESLLYSNIVHRMTDLDFVSLAWWFLQTYHVRLLFDSSIERGHGPYVWPGTVVLDCSNHWWLLRLSFQPQVQCWSL